MKKRILFVTDFTGLHTGYSVYMREVISRLFATDKYDIAEFASYIHINDVRTRGIPWKLYHNLPDQDNKEQVALYESSKLNSFGAWRFEKVALDFKPDIVISIRDFWMESFVGHSPYRKCFKWIWMAPCDAEPQDPTWIDVFSTTDRLLTYTDWAKDVISNQGGHHINIGPSASPSATPEFQPINNKEALKAEFGLGGTKIIGTVMRNQRRKLYPDLFKTFRKYLDDTHDQNTLLYCHTAYPDLGWDIPYLLNSNGIQHKTLFTYRCVRCGHAYPNLFRQTAETCARCGNHSVTLAGVNNGLDNDGLCKVYNLFDVYVQYANSEGFGLPMVEAAACGVPVMAVDYSAMSEVVRKVNGIPLKVSHLSMELETGCLRAIPDNSFLLEKMKEILSMPSQLRMRKGYEARSGVDEHYSSWDNVAKIWENEIDQMEVNDVSWTCPTLVREPNLNIPQDLNNEEFVNFLFAEVLGEPDKIFGFMSTRLLRDLNMGATTKNPMGLYFNEDSVMFSKNETFQFGRNEALQHVLKMAQYRNMWENLRREELGV